MSLTPGCNILPLLDITCACYAYVASLIPEHNIISHSDIAFLQPGLELTTMHACIIVYTMTALHALDNYTTHMYLLHDMMMRRKLCASLLPTVNTICSSDTRCQYLLPWYPYLLLILDTFNLTPRLDLEQRAPVSLLTISNGLAT